MAPILREAIGSRSSVSGSAARPAVDAGMTGDKLAGTGSGNLSAERNNEELKPHHQ